MNPDDTDRMDTIPAPPPSHVEMVSFMRPPAPGLLELDDSGIFAFSLDSDALDED
jgi:hypothetical protein